VHRQGSGRDVVVPLAGLVTIVVRVPVRSSEFQPLPGPWSARPASRAGWWSRFPSTVSVGRLRCRAGRHRTRLCDCGVRATWDRASRSTLAGVLAVRSVAYHPGGVP